MAAFLRDNTGVGGAYTLGDLDINLTSSNVRSVQTIKFRAKNTAGNGTYVHNDTKVQVHTASQSGVSELAIPVSDSLGDGSLTNDGKRVFSFSGDTIDTPSYQPGDDFYNGVVYTESSDPGVEGTKRPTVRFGVIEHDTTDYSTGFLPVGPMMETLELNTSHSHFSVRLFFDVYIVLLQVFLVFESLLLEHR